MSFDTEREIYVKKLDRIINGIEKINAIQNSRIISSDTRTRIEEYKDKSKKLLSKLEKEEFEIAVVGLEKAGKSSFSNAIMDNDVLPTADARCTYTSTCIKAGKFDNATIKFFSVDEFNNQFRDKLKQMEIPNVDIYTYNTLSEDSYNNLFNNTEESIKEKYENSINQDILDIIKNSDSLSKYIGSSPKQYHGNELSSDEFKDFIQKPQKAIAAKEIVIETTKFASMKNAIMYDVPGFDSPTAIHKQQTLSKMRDVDAIIMVANAKAPSLRGPELDILKEKDMDGAPLSDKLFVFSNKADMVDSPQSFESNKETTYNEWIERRKITDRKDRIFFGSAIASLGDKVGDVGNDARAKLAKLQISDGIGELKEGLEKYYKNERFNILKKRVDSIISNIQDMFEKIRADKDLIINKDLWNNELVDLAFRLLDSSKCSIQGDLEVLKGNVNTAEQDRALSNAIESNIQESITVANYEITEEELEAVHRNKAGNGINENPTAVEPALREAKFRIMYNDFQAEISNVAIQAHKNNLNEIVNIFKKNLGLQDRNSYNDAVVQNIIDFINGRRETGDIEEEYFNSLIERFARDIYEILILRSRGQDRYNKFRERAENYLSMSVFYSAKKAKDSQDKYSYTAATPAKSPMWKYLLWPELFDGTSDDYRSKVWEVLKKITGVGEGESTSVDRRVDMALKKYGDRSVTVITSLFNSFIKSGPKAEIVLAIRDLLDDCLNNDTDLNNESESLTDILSGTNKSVKRSRGNVGSTEFTYKDIQEEFKADIKVLNEILQNAFIEAVNMDRAFSAREVGLIENIIQKINGKEFRTFIQNNLQLIKFDEMSKIEDEQEKQKADSVIMAQINEILENLDIKVI